MDVITGFMLGIFIGWIIGVIRALSTKAFIVIFMVLIVLSIAGILQGEVTGANAAKIWGWTDLALIVGSMIGMSSGKLTVEEMKQHG
jgi:hypothetical protein